jgi:transcription elongation factor Elf1
MTTQIIMRQSNDPTTCMCCGRHAASIGVAKPRATMTTWTCDNPECIQSTKVLIMSKQNELNAYETRAIEAVSRHKADDIMSACVQALFDAGITDLSEIDPDKATLATDSLIVNSTMQTMVRGIVLDFGDCIRADVMNNEVPF